MSIKTTINKDLTTIKASGNITTEELLDWIINYFNGPTTTSKIIWDLREVISAEMGLEDIRLIAHTAKELSSYSKGRTALVASSEMVYGTSAAYGLSRMYEIQAELVGMPRTVAAFNDIQEALDWLEAD
jgi:hypothetical protein